DLAKLARRSTGDVPRGQGIERAGKPDHPVDFLVQRLERRAVRGHDTVPKGFEVALQVGQRSAQLMCGVGDELASHSLLLLDLAGHAVERCSEGSDLVGTAGSHANAVIILSAELRGLADLAEGR